MQATLFKFLQLTFVLIRFLKEAALDVKMVHLICTNSLLFTATNLHKCEVLLQRPAATNLELVSVKLIDTHQVQQVLRQLPWLADSGTL
jgi:hypothetical protein